MTPVSDHPINVSAERDIEAFFHRHPLFTVEDLDGFLARRVSLSRSPSPQSRAALLAYHRQQGHVLPIRRGLWASIPPGEEAQTYPVDSYLLASRLTADAVLAYHTALELHGIAHSLREERVVLSEQPLVRPLKFRGASYRAVRPPSVLAPADRLTLGVETQNRQGLNVRITTLERTIVDALDRPTLVGGWEEVWRSLEGAGDIYLDTNFLIRYALLLENATTAAKVGYFLETQKKTPLQALAPLKEHIPKAPHYVERGRREHTRLIRSWNLLVPVGLSETESDTEILV